MSDIMVGVIIVGVTCVVGSLCLLVVVKVLRVALDIILEKE